MKTINKIRVNNFKGMVEMTEKGGVMLAPVVSNHSIVVELVDCGDIISHHAGFGCSLRKREYHDVVRIHDIRLVRDTLINHQFGERVFGVVSYRADIEC